MRANYFILTVALLTSAAQAQTPVVVAFQKLPANRQLQIAKASLESVSVALALTQAETKGTPAARQLSSCLRDRDGKWALGVMHEYIAKHGNMPISIGAAFTQAFAWRCGVLTFSTEAAK